MVDRIYTQADYDKVTNLYNEYQNKKDSYTPEQQQKIEAAFSNAWTNVSNKIEEWNNRIVDMGMDEQGNTRQEYGNGRREIVNYAPSPAAPKQSTPRVNPTPTPTPTPTPSNEQGGSQIPDGYTQEEIDRYGLIGPQTEPYPTPSSSSNNNSSYKQDYYSKYMQMKGTGAPSVEIAKWFKGGFGEANSRNASLVRNDLKKKGLTDQQINDFIQDRSRATLMNPQYQQQLNSPYRIQSKGNDGTYGIKGADEARQRLINRGYTVGEDGRMYKPDGTPLLG